MAETESCSDDPKSLWMVTAAIGRAVFSQVKQQGGTQLRLSTENWIKDLLSMAPPIRITPSLLLNRLSHQEASISFLSFSIRGQTE